MTNDTNEIKRSEIQKSRSQEPLLLVSVVEPGIFWSAAESNLLRQSKIKNEEIELLGGNPKRNDLIAYLS